MKKHTRRMLGGLIAFGLLALFAMPALAQVGGEFDGIAPDTISYTRVLTYVSCAIGVATAPTVIGLALTVANCLALIETP